MKAASAGLIAHLGSDSLTLATLWRVTRIDGQVFRFTDSDRDRDYGGETYLAALGYRRAAVASGADLAVDETELEGLLNSASISEAELRAGLWDGADVRIFVVNYADLTMGEIKLRRAHRLPISAIKGQSNRSFVTSCSLPCRQAAACSTPSINGTSISAAPGADPPVPPLLCRAEPALRIRMPLHR